MRKRGLISFLLFGSTYNSFFHVRSKEMVGEERNKKKRMGEKMREKKGNQSHFHCFVGYEIYFSSLNFFPSPPFLSLYFFKLNMT